MGTGHSPNLPFSIGLLLLMLQVPTWGSLNQPIGWFNLKVTISGECPGKSCQTLFIFQQLITSMQRFYVKISQTQIIFTEKEKRILVSEFASLSSLLLCCLLVICDRWFVTRDTWLLTPDTWHLTIDRWNLKKNIYCCYYPHTTRDSVSPLKGFNDWKWKFVCKSVIKK